MPSQAQPQAMPFLNFRLDAVVCLEPAGLGPSTVITAGDSFTLRTELGFDGLFVPLLVGDTFNVFHHVQRVEDGAAFVLPLAGATFAVPAPPASAHIAVPSGPYSTGSAGSGANLEIPAGFAAGTYRVLTHVHAVAAGIAPIVAAFHDGLIIMVT